MPYRSRGPSTLAAMDAVVERAHERALTRYEREQDELAAAEDAREERECQQYVRSVPPGLPPADELSVRCDERPF